MKQDVRKKEKIQKPEILHRYTEDVQDRGTGNRKTAGKQLVQTKTKEPLYRILDKNSTHFP